MPSRLSVLSEGSSSPGCAGSGICLTQTITFMAAHCYRRPADSPNPVRSSRPAREGRWYVVPLRILLVVNSFASSVTARNTVVVHRRLSRDHDVELVETNRRGHATRFAHDAARRGVDVVVGFGGDGTLNEVATGIAGTDTALGVLPGGSTNVFARTIGLPNDPVAAAELLADGIDAGDFRPIGLGQVNGRYFCFHTGVGYDAAVVADGRAAGVTEALARPPAVHHRRPSRPGPAATTAGARTSGSTTADARRRGRLLHDRAQHQPVHVPRQPAARPVARRDARPRARRASRSARCGPRPILRSLAGALRGGGVEPTARARRADRPRPPGHRARRPRSPTSSTATTSARSTASSSTTSPTPSAS